MRYLKIDWHHDHANEPVSMYSELDDEQWERRKVEVFRSGAMSFASSDKSTGSTWLSIEPFPSIEEIAAQPQFAPNEISRSEFEQIWTRAMDAQR